MASGRDKEDTRGFSWVDMKDSKGNIVKDGKGNAVKTRKFGAKAEAPAASPKPKAKPTAKAAPKAAPKPKVSATATATAGSTKGAAATANVARSGAARSTENKVKPKGRTPVPGMALVQAVKNAFTGKGETNAGTIAGMGGVGRKKKK